MASNVILDSKFVSHQLLALRKSPVPLDKNAKKENAFVSVHPHPPKAGPVIKVKQHAFVVAPPIISKTKKKSVLQVVFKQLDKKPFVAAVLLGGNSVRERPFNSATQIVRHGKIKSNAKAPITESVTLQKNLVPAKKAVLEEPSAHQAKQMNSASVKKTNMDALSLRPRNALQIQPVRTVNVVLVDLERQNAVAPRSLYVNPIAAGGMLHKIAQETANAKTTNAEIALASPKPLAVQQAEKSKYAKTPVMAGKYKQPVKQMNDVTMVLVPNVLATQEPNAVKEMPSRLVNPTAPVGKPLKPVSPANIVLQGPVLFAPVTKVKSAATGAMPKSVKLIAQAGKPSLFAIEANIALLEPAKTAHVRQVKKGVQATHPRSVKQIAPGGAIKQPAQQVNV